MREERLLHRKEGEKRHNRQLTVLISFCAALIIVATVETALFANPEGYLAWLEINPETTTAEYSAFILTRYLLDIFVPVALALYTYFSIRRLGTPTTYRLIWGAIIAVTAGYKFLTFQTASVFWYLTLVLLAALFLVVINIHRLESVPMKK
ncbi:MAG: hypothetical protein KA485_00950 [Clostridia bacterium]|jgi:hypothetical protein|nr:hypothetical protein [Clostridia bacterium]MBP6161486.1 hypothetical protein [Clostridia bacterium]MBP6949787.1 hypothetical protein [Clostridia bacterium]